MTLLQRAIQAGLISPYLDNYNVATVQEMLSKLQIFEQLKEKFLGGEE